VELLKFIVPSATPFVIAPLGDIQWNGDPDEIDCGGLERHIQRALDANAYFVGQGDYIDFASPSSRGRLLSSGAYDGPMKKLDDVGLELVEQVFNRFLKPTKGRWVGMLEGHHFWAMKDGITTDQTLCRLLGTTHLGTEAGIEWTVKTSSTGYVTFQTWHHHGWGSGEESNLLLKLKKVAADWDGVSAFFLGHMTKVATTVIPKLRMEFHRHHAVTERRVLLIGTGGWSKGKQVGRREGRVPRGGYVERRGLRPVSLGAPLVRVTVETLRRGESDSHRNRQRLYIPVLEALNR
jgi:phosphoribosyl-AMP cyclohydrolase